MDNWFILTRCQREMELCESIFVGFRNSPCVELETPLCFSLCQQLLQYADDLA